MYITSTKSKQTTAISNRALCSIERVYECLVLALIRRIQLLAGKGSLSDSRLGSNSKSVRF